MELALLLIVIVAVPVIALVWTRRGRGGGGETGTDPQAHRDIGAGGHPQHAQGSEWGGGGNNI